LVLSLNEGVVVIGCVSWPQASNVPRFCVRPCLQWPTRLKGLARLTCFLCFSLQLKSIEIHWFSWFFLDS
jgi:hypothetical protein